ncbi:MAG: dihydropteroate synthase [Methylocystaceae bacterium]
MPIFNRTTGSRQLNMAGGRYLQLGEKTLVMGILNVTPDSFSDGGRFCNPAEALAHAQEMQDEGADIIDIGGQSTRPGSRVVNAEEEWQRLAPVLPQLVKKLTVPVSVDTYYQLVAERALEQGAHIINDVSGFKVDPGLAEVVYRYGAAVVIMHARLHSGYQDLMTDVKSELRAAVDWARTAGISNDQIVIDPGIGFGKTAEENLVLLGHLNEFKALDYPVLLGASRKSFLGQVFGLSPEERLEGNLAAAAAGIMAGVDILRVHDVGSTVRLARVLEGILNHG